MTPSMDCSGQTLGMVLARKVVSIDASLVDQGELMRGEQ